MDVIVKSPDQHKTVPLFDGAGLKLGVRCSFGSSGGCELRASGPSGGLIVWDDDFSDHTQRFELKEQEQGFASALPFVNVVEFVYRGAPSQVLNGRIVVLPPDLDTAEAFGTISG